jgi:hypothetical protein
MRTVLILSALLISMSANADTLTYSGKYSGDGCDVDVETRTNGQIFYVSKDGKTEIIGLTKDLSKGTFAYCDDSALQIHSFTGNKGTGIMMACSGHKNGSATTRGRVDIEIINKKLTNIAIDGQKKGFFTWKQDTKIVCSNLLRQALH